jgi:hypothetical protein
MFEEDLARNGASHGEHYETEQKERHSFSSTRAADLPTKKTPSATRRMPIRRCDEIVSPKKSHEPIATIIWFVAARLKADDQRNGLQRKKPGKENPIIASIPNQIQKAKKLEVVYQGDTNCVLTLQQDLGDGGQNHADKELKVRMKESRLTAFLSLICGFR